MSDKPDRSSLLKRFFETYHGPWPKINLGLPPEPPPVRPRFSGHQPFHTVDIVVSKDKARRGSPMQITFPDSSA